MPFITQGKTNLKYILIVVILAAIGAGVVISYQNWWIAKINKLENNLPKLKSPEVKISSFEECAKAGYPILLTYPPQCKTPDGRTFIEKLSVECKKDSECAENHYCQNNLCKEFLIDTNCQKDAECQLINKELKLSCCWSGRCDKIDYSQEKWIAVNKNWFEEQRNKNCLPKNDCGPALMCPEQIINENFTAQCINNLCIKVAITQRETQICGPDTLCTADIRAMCNPETGEVWKGPSRCGCGLDADYLSKKGWVDCPEKLE